MSLERSVALGTLIATACIAGAQQSPPHYHVTVLNIPGDVDPNNDVVLTNNGVVVTPVVIDDQGYAVALNTMTGESHVFGFLTGLIQWIGGANELGAAVGISSPGNPFIYQNGVTSLLPMPPSATSGRALGINDLGIAVGAIYQTREVPARWDTHTGVVTVLPAPNSIESEAVAINNLGTVAGYVHINGMMYPAVWSQGGMTLLPRFGGPYANVTAINDAGQVLFNAADVTWDAHAYVWANGVTTQIAANIPGGSWGAGMNQSGTVVGSADGEPIVVLNGDVFFLRPLLVAPIPDRWWLLEGPKAINDDGVIVAVGADFDAGSYFLVLLTPTHCGSADFDHDGDSGTDQDIGAFFACLAGACCAACDSVDFNGDGDLGTDADIESFFRVLGGGPC